MEHVQSGMSPHRANAADTHEAIAQLSNAAHNTFPIMNSDFFFFLNQLLYLEILNTDNI